ncbi:uncharacterized protein [Temnothorax longispinosus]|uniref:uncharacterized protein n=1 Tax=Temnothorax longispinosus TaxID=300112 RepID=UPI003A9960C6
MGKILDGIKTRTPEMATLGLSKVFILDKYFTSILSSGRPRRSCKGQADPEKRTPQCYYLGNSSTSPAADRKRTLSISRQPSRSSDPWAQRKPRYKLGEFKDRSLH